MILENVVFCVEENDQIWESSYCTEKTGRVVESGCPPVVSLSVFSHFQSQFLGQMTSLNGVVRQNGLTQEIRDEDELLWKESSNIPVETC